jgi:hypothetical protein
MRHNMKYIFFVVFSVLFVSSCSASATNKKDDISRCMKLFHGPDTPKTTKEALSVCKRACDDGSMRGCGATGQVYGSLGEFNKENSYLKKAADMMKNRHDKS